METYLVGGAVRDRLLNIPVTEWDYVVVGSTADEMRALGFRPVGKDFPVFLHPDTNAEYALARTERKRGRGHTGFECETEAVTLEQDLMRRDLTINAIAEDDEGNLIDPWNGVADLKDRVLRHVSPAFAEDPLRVLRVARFAARLSNLGFTVHPDTANLMRKIVRSGELETLAPERVFVEAEKALMADSPQVFFKVLHHVGADRVLWPTIRDADIELLGKVAGALPEPHQRFACLVSNQDMAAIEQIEAHVRLPRIYTRFARLITENATAWLSLESMTDEEVVAFFYRVDAIRQPGRFVEFNLVASEIAIANGIAGADDLAISWSRFFGLVQKVSASDVDPSRAGPEIGKAIREAQVAAVSAAR